jgi:hypothetical protein
VNIILIFRGPLQPSLQRNNDSLNSKFNEILFISVNKFIKEKMSFQIFFIDNARVFWYIQLTGVIMNIPYDKNNNIIHVGDWIKTRTFASILGPDSNPILESDYIITQVIDIIFNEYISKTVVYFDNLLEAYDGARISTACEVISKEEAMQWKMEA